MTEEKLFIIGAGFMGIGIAQNAATCGIEVTVYDVAEEFLVKGRKTVEAMLQKNVSKGKMTEQAMQDALAKISFTAAISDCGDADFIIEAAVEDEPTKISIAAEVDKYARDDAVVASNTSSISITKLARHLHDASRFVGMHFFSPAPLMSLLEVVEGMQTSEQTRDRAIAFGERLGKTCIVSKDDPGFIVNRLLIPMLNEAAMLLECGVGSIEEIDLGARLGLGHPMGPLELADMIGVDVELAIMEVLFSQIGDSKYRPAVLLRRMVASGYLGRKTRQGFYIYNEDGSHRPNPKLVR